MTIDANLIKGFEMGFGCAVFLCFIIAFLMLFIIREKISDDRNHLLLIQAMALMFVIAFCGCGHGRKIEEGSGPAFSWPCGGDVAVPGRPITDCR